MRIRLDLAYDGTYFYGWGVQPDVRTVQGELEKALNTVIRPAQMHQGIDVHGGWIRTVVAGRTDTGVHARHQVAHFDVEPSQWDNLPAHSNRTPETALMTRLRGVLPEDIAVHAVNVVEKTFDARFSAKSRTYKYRIADGLERHDPITRHNVTWIDWNLDEAVMQEAADHMIGLHDFAAFAKARPGGTTIRDLHIFSWERDKTGVLVATLTADAFAHNMVRSLVGASIVVGSGKKNVEWMNQKLISGEREGKTGPAAPRGLTLENIEYPNDEHERASRAQSLRAKRVLPVE